MNLSEDCLQRCAAQAKVLEEEYKLFTRNIGGDRKSLDDLAQFCGDCLGVKITPLDILIPANDQTVVRGVMLAKTEPDGTPSYELGILENQPEDMRRFVTCKEFCQVALHDDKAETMNLYDHVVAMAAQELQPLTPGVIAERMAEVTAMQFLYPYADRVHDCRLLAEGKETFESLARHYGIPRGYVEIYLSRPVMDRLQKSHSLEVLEPTRSPVSNAATQE